MVLNLLSLIYFPGPSVQQARPGALVNTIPSPIPSWLSKVKIKFNPQNSTGPRHSLLPTFSTIHIFPSCSQEFTRSVNTEATACPGSFFRRHKRDPTLFTSCWAVTDFIFLGSQITTDSDSSPHYCGVKNEHSGLCLPKFCFSGSGVAAPSPSPIAS